MTQVYRVLGNCEPSSQPDTYIYEIVPASDNKVAVITSSDQLILLDREDFRASEAFNYKGVPKELTCLVAADDGRRLTCSGRKGDVSAFDVRARERASHFKTDRAVTALACRGDYVAIGSELAHHEAIVSVWDRRMNKMMWKNPENNDDITAVSFHPRISNFVLAGGDDGQVSVFDMSIAEEDDSLVQGINHGPIHKAGFLDDGYIYALSSDQNLSIYPLTSSEEQGEDLPALHLKDVRPIVPCEYVIDIFMAGDDAVVATGTHSQSRVDLIKLRAGHGLDLDQRIIVRADHGEEIIRSIFVDTSNESIYTAGEDGKVAVYQKSSSSEENPSSTKASRFHKSSESRFKPY